MHALATALGTRRWPTRVVENPGRTLEAATPPAGLRIIIHRIPARNPPGTPDDTYKNYVASGFVDADLRKHVEGGYECDVTPGSYIEYGLPFQLQISHFRFGLGQCCRDSFRDWKFEAFDGKDWRELYSETRRWNDENLWIFPVSPRDAFASSRFRLRLAGDWNGHWSDARHMHVRGLEVFGTILPPWRL